MRIVLDLQACQTEGSRNRGVGRYSQSLAIHIGRLKGNHDIRFCCNGNYQYSYLEAVNKLRCVTERNITDYRYPNLIREYPGDRNTRVQVAEALIRQHWLALQPDVLHLSHVFEGFAGEAVVPHRLPRIAGLLRSATVYDLIPLRFQEQYLRNPRFKRWYFEKLGTLRECDLLLVNSDSTKKDVAELVGVDSSRVVTIWGGVNSHFKARKLCCDDVADFRNRFNLRGRFVLYTGGDDYRKNIEGAIAGFATVPSEIRRQTQLVIVCSMPPHRQAMYLQKARKYGLSNEDVLFPGFVAEEDLITFYNLCDVFVFPSFYEGFGLPVLEAMACGAPVVGGNNSSIREIVRRDDALFDPQRHDSIAGVLAKVLSQPSFQNDLRCYGLQRVKEFHWERSAKLALEAFENAYSKIKDRCQFSSDSVIPRKRLAIFSPLPPCRSGIADYNAAFLPFLAKYFDIELFVDDYDLTDQFIRANFPVHSHLDFPALVRRYDAVMYELGNSEFHAYMLNYLEHYPGIMVLHDAYLSGLYGHLEFYMQQPGRYFMEMLYSHGPRARRYFAPIQEYKDPLQETMIKLPCTRSVIENAIGIISHSPFNVEVARMNYPEGWAAPYHVINQMVRLQPMVNQEDRRNYRIELGFDEEDFIVCSFGHIVWTKCGDLLLEAFSRSSLAHNPKAKLVFAGELARNDFGRNLDDAINQGAFKDRVRITDYLSESNYSKYMAISNLAVQLRKNSRGGTPKGVLDCLANGVPVIVNNDASYKDYPDGILLKVSPDPRVEELAAALDRSYQARLDLIDFGAAGREYVEREHHPEKIAAQYAVAINEFMHRGKAVSFQSRIEEVAVAIARDHNADDTVIDEVALALHHNMARPLFRQQRILIDVSHIAATEFGTGIQRVVRNIVRWLYCSERAGFQPIAVRLSGDGLVEATEWLETNGLLSTFETTAESRDRKVNLAWGDILLMLDSSWAQISEFQLIFEMVHQLQGKVYTVVYDLLPIQLPQFFVPGGSEWFSGWLHKAIDNSDGFICISRSIAEEVVECIRKTICKHSRHLRVGYWHLGGDFRKNSEISSLPMDRVKKALSTRSFLMVGTIEPRKGHALALDAMEILWGRGHDVALCIAGKKAWMVDELMARISCHPELNKKLHFIDRPSDEELEYSYRHSLALLFPSAGEGFGLPLIEAAQFGTPIIASDIPVFREIAGEHASYFPLGSSHDLATYLEQWLRKNEAGDIPDSQRIRWLTWEQSAEQLLDVILHNQWYKLLPED